jgi:N-[(2S)-2-amino-2-carboxyethyl]-L-glutamate dehydrogenase
MPPVELMFLSQEEVVEAGGLDMSACLDTIEATLALHHRGETVSPPKASIHWSDDLDSDEKLGRIMAMPAYVGGDIDMAGLKWIPSVPSNPERGLPRGIGLIVLSDPLTGLPRAVLDGTIVSAMRTGAVTGVAVRHLARRDAAVVLLLGAGVQARTQLLALERTVPALAEIRLYDPRTDKADALAAERADLPIRVVAEPAAAARDADVIVPATMAADPFITPDWLAPGSLLVSVSSLDPTVETVTAADLVVADDVEHETAHPARLLARAEAAGLLDRSAVVPLGAIAAGAHPGRTRDDERIVVSPIGLGIEDVAWATEVVRRAETAGLGQRVGLWREPIWV